ncbi:MAG: hypothetical protein WCP55_02885 [Lentisphaerota bacterium]
MGYLYGASIQGIQNFIFETNKLKEMIGASELVNQICEESYKDYFKGKADNVYLSTAGNIKLVAETEDEIKELVLKLPKRAQEMAPGITLSQAVVVFDGELKKEDMDNLEEKLKIQRNKVNRPSEIGLAASLRSRRTGKPASGRTGKPASGADNDYELADKGTLEKSRCADDSTKGLIKCLGENLQVEDFPFDFDDIGSSWLAVIHADGNALGKIIQALGKHEGQSELKSTYKYFSEAIDKSTKSAAQKAFNEIVKKEKTNGKYPLRPIILGGDDLTVICRADIAIPFTVAYLKAFTEETKNNLSSLKGDFCKTGLTACAGISFIKKSYPFHYAYKLAETLCKEAKKKSDRKCSAIAFHKVMSSFVEDYKTIVDRELTAKASAVITPNGKPSPVTFDFGPYAIADNPKMPNIEKILGVVNELPKFKGIKSGLRRWLSELHENQESAEMLLQRINQVAKKKEKDEFDKIISQLDGNLSLSQLIVREKTPVYDILSILSLKGDE